MERLESRRLLSAGDLDPTFSGNGTLIADLGGTETVRDVAVQGDGKIIVVGSTEKNGNSDAFVARYTAAGVLDSGFGSAGVAKLNFAANDSANEVVIRPDGKIVVGGVGGTGFLAQFTSAGKLDTTWAGGDGIVNDSGPVEAIALLSDGKLVTGYGDTVSRFTSVGALDGSFGSAGRRNVLDVLFNDAEDNIPDFISFQILDIDVQPGSGALILSGNANGPSETDVAVVRVTSGGSVDTTFSGGGAYFADYGNGSNRSMGAAIQSSGQIIVPWQHDVDVIRVEALTPTGAVIDSFGSGGRIYTALPLFDGNVIGTDIALDAQNRILIAGSGRVAFANPGEGESFSLAVRRFTPNGENDYSFSLDGLAWAMPEGLVGIAKAMAIAPDGKIVLAGGYNPNLSSDTVEGITVARFEGGSSPLAIGPDGRLTINLSDAAEQVALTATGNSLSFKLDYAPDRVFTFPGTPNVVINAKGGFDQITATGNMTLLVNAGDGNDSVMIEGGKATVFGGNGEDGILGGSGNDSLVGDAGDDFLDGRGGGDTLKGGSGNDTADYSARTANLIIGLGTLSDDGEAGEKDNLAVDIETIIGGSGNDNIRGSNSANRLEGRDGNDTLLGLGGNDTLVGGIGTDRLDGGADNDTASNDAGDTLLSIENDNFGGSIINGVLIVRGTPNDDEIPVVYSSGQDTVYVSVNEFESSFNIDDFASIQILGGNGNDRLLLSINQLSRAATLFGEAGNDTLTGGDGAQRLDGDSGDDSIEGSRGNDTLIGGDADDTLVGGDDDDSLLGGPGNDFLEGDAGNDTLDGGAGFDVLDGGTGANVLLNGESGPEIGVVVTPDRTLLVQGTLGADQIFVVGGSASGFFTVTQVTVNGKTTGVDATRFDRIEVRALDGRDRVEFRFIRQYHSGTIDGGPGDDTLLGAGANDRLLGRDGNDSVDGGDGVDLLDGGAGADTLKGGAGNDTVDYSSRAANLTIGIGTLADDGEANEKDNVYLDIETVLGGSGNDNIRGGDANNLLVGNGGNDSLRGNYGDDTLSGDAGTDTLNGEAGTDTAINSTGDTLISIENSSGGNDPFIDGGKTLRIGGTAGADHVSIINGGNDQTIVSVNGKEFHFAQSSFSHVSIDVLGGDDDVSIQAPEFLDPIDVVINAGDGNDHINVVEYSPSILGGAGNDTVDWRDASGSFDGGSGTDEIHDHTDDGSTLDLNTMPTVENASIVRGLLVGNALNNHLVIELSGTVQGGGGNDLLEAGTAGAHDGSRLEGGTGDDTLMGGDSDDTLDGGAGADLMKGGGGNDTADYSSRWDKLIIGIGTLADDGEVGEKDNVYVDIETVLGGSGSDSITGGAADNLLVGNGGNDTLKGNYGNDTLEGDKGADLLDGGPDIDTAANDGSDTLISIEHSSAVTAYIDNNRTLVLDGTSDDDRLFIEGLTNSDQHEAAGMLFQNTDFDRILVRGFGGSDDLEIHFSGKPATLDGGEGNDFFDIFESAASLIGGNGDDEFYWDSGGSLVGFDGGPGTDLLRAEDDAPISYLDLRLYPTVENANLYDGTLIGNDLNNVLNLKTSGTILGGAGNDSLGAEENEGYLYFDGQEGDDLISGSGNGTIGNTLFGGAGNDRIVGSAGNDSIEGGEGNDVINGASGGDTMKGGSGNDTVDYSEYVSDLTIGIGTLADDGEAGEGDNVWLDIETVLGGSGNDKIAGGDANNLLVGNGGNDSIRGNYGNDTLSGGSGTDTLNGDLGDDTATDNAGDILISIEHS